MIRPRLFASTVVTLLTASFCHAAGATSAYYAFTGVIDSNHTEYATLTTFSGLFSFDPSQPDLAPADPDNGYYPMDSAVHALSVAFANGPSFLTDPMASYGATVHRPLATVSNQPPDHGRFDLDGTVFGQVDRFTGLSFRKDYATDALPGATGDFGLADFDQVLFYYDGLTQAAPGPNDPVVPPYGALGHLTSLACIDGCVGFGGPAPSAVPEPTTMALLFAGLALPGLFHRRRRVA